MKKETVMLKPSIEKDAIEIRLNSFMLRYDHPASENEILARMMTMLKIFLRDEKAFNEMMLYIEKMKNDEKNRSFTGKIKGLFKK